MKPGYGFALANRVRCSVPLPTGGTFEAWFACPEDVIVGKLMAWRAGRSFKHEQDIHDMLLAVRLGDDLELTEMFNAAYVDQWARRLGQEVEERWQRLKALAGSESGAPDSEN